MPTHVGIVGQGNRAIYESRVRDIRLQHPSVNLDALAELADTALPATNVTPSKIEQYAAAGAIIDARSLAIAEAGGDRGAGLAAFAAKQGPYFKRREAFENLWVRGHSFIYFSANPGNKGPDRFGAFCLVIRSGRVLNDDAAVFPSDTAQRYGYEDGNVDAALAFTEVAWWQSRADVAVYELGAAAASRPQAELANLLCGADGYLEVVAVAPVDAHDVIELRLTHDEVDELDRLSISLHTRVPIDAASQQMAQAYNAVLTWPNVHLRIV